MHSNLSNISGALDTSVTAKSFNSVITWKQHKNQEIFNEAFPSVLHSRYYNIKPLKTQVLSIYYQIPHAQHSYVMFNKTGYV